MSKLESIILTFDTDDIEDLKAIQKYIKNIGIVCRNEKTIVQMKEIYDNEK